MILLTQSYNNNYCNAFKDMNVYCGSTCEYGNQQMHYPYLVTPLKQIESDLRPVSLTAIQMKEHLYLSSYGLS